MNDVPRHVLRRIVAKYGKDLGGNARRCEGLLKDFCGEYRREINVLTSAVEERIPLNLLSVGNSMPRELLLTRLARRLEDNLGLTAEAARWAIDSWALALGVVTEKEIEEAKKESSNLNSIAPSKQSLPSPQNSESLQKSKIQSLPNQNRFPKTPPLPSQVSLPPLATAPVNFPVPATAAPPVQKSNPNQIPAKNLPPPNVPITNAAPRKYFRRFFGCLIILFLLSLTGIVLIFGVPYTIRVMRETQQQNEPPRFPGP